MAKKKELPPVEWTHIIDAESITNEPHYETIMASEQACLNLARRLNVNKINNLKADLEISREAGNRLIHVSGDFSAKVTQPCVVTLDPIEQGVSGHFEAWFADPDHTVSIAKARQERISRVSGAEVEMLEERDDPEPVIDGQIDVGELVAQHLSLALDPYPHKQGAEHEKAVDIVPTDEQAPPRRQNPFARLKEWKEQFDREK